MSAQTMNPSQSFGSTMGGMVGNQLGGQMGGATGLGSQFGGQMGSQFGSQLGNQYGSNLEGGNYGGSQLPSSQLGATNMASKDMGLAPQMAPQQFGSQQLGSQQLGSQQLGSQQFGSQQLGSQQFGSQPLDYQQGGMSNQMLGKSIMEPQGEWLSNAPQFGWYQGEKTMSSSMGSQISDKALFSPGFGGISAAPTIASTIVSSPSLFTTAPLGVSPIASIPRGTIHHVHSEKGLRGPVPGATAIGETQPLPPGIIPEHVTEELVTEMPIGLKKKTGRAARRHEDDYHRNLELARADLLKAAEYFKLGNMALHDEHVGKALLHQKEAERHLRMTYRR